MDAHRWRRVRAILERASELPAPERSACVRRECGDDADLVRDVERLLVHADDGVGFLEPRALHAPLDDQGDDPDIAPGTRAGPYRIERKLGAGGMGAVWLAVREGDVPQRVALKVVRSRSARASIQKRFRNERAVLASLEHPGIARLIDAGDLADGRPYLAMEYVEGVPIDRWCDERELDVRARIELFLCVCDAVEHAHHHLVVHRDLKPSNILVGAGGQPKLLDFGIAKVLADDAGLDLTRTGEVLFTPRYASPEQVRGDVVGTASDVYSLGVVLYALLTGAEPYAFETDSPAEVVRVITSREPPRPSDAAQRVSTAERASELRGDLDNILLMALRKEPERRYGSVEQLSRDLRRHLDDLPVSARADTLRYRWTKFARRNRAALIAGVLTFATLVSGLTASLILYDRARRARDGAEWQAYVANIAAAEAAIRANDVADAERRLARAPEHLRGFEWHHLARRLDRSSHTFHAHEIVYGIAFQPGGPLLATAGADGTVQLWNTTPDRRVAESETIAKEAFRLEFVTFSADGERLAWPGGENELRVFSVAKHAVVATLSGHGSRVRAAEFLPDGESVVTAARDGSIRVTDIESGATRRVIPVDGAFPGRIAVDPLGTLVATGASDSSLRVYRIADGELVFSRRDLAIRSVAFDSTGTRLVTGSLDGTAHVWDVASGAETQRFVGHTALVDDALFLPDGKRIVTASWDRTLRIWDAASGRELAVMRGHHGNICALDLDRAGTTLASGENGGAIRLWSVAAEDVRTVRHTSWQSEIAFLDSGDLVFGDNDCVRIVDPRSGSDVASFATSPVDKDRFALSVGGGIVAFTLEGERDVELWTCAPAPERVTALHHDAVLSSIAMDRAGSWLASGTTDERVHVWSIAEQKLVATHRLGGGLAASLEFDPRGNAFVAGTREGSVYRFVARSGELAAERRIAASRVNDLAYSPDGSRIAAACADGTIRLIDATSLGEYATLAGHGRDVECVAFSPRGDRIASGGADYAIKLWDAESGDEVATLHGHGFTVRSVAFSRDGTRLASHASDTSVRIWDTSDPR